MASRSEARPPSVTPCESCPLRLLSSFRPFEAEELAFVKSLKSGELVAEAGTTILLDGSNSPHLFTVLSGWAVRYKLLAEGRRQVLNFALPGDLLGLQASIFKEMQHSVDALTDVRLCVFPRQRIWELFKNYPGLAFDLTWLASREESILADHLASVGQRSAYARIAYMIVHLFDRARRSGLARQQASHACYTTGSGGRDGPVDRSHEQDAKALTCYWLDHMVTPEPDDS